MKKWNAFEPIDCQIYPLSSPFIVCWDTTMKCQQQCTFCYNPSNIRSGRKDAPNPPLDHQLRILEIIADAGVFEIDLMGGEPLSIPINEMKEIVQYAHRRNMAVNIITNGVNAGKQFRGQVAPYIKDIGFSLHGPNPDIHNKVVGIKAYDTAVNNIVSVARETECGIGVLFSAINSNLRYIEETLENLLEKLGNNKEKLLFFYLNRMVCHPGTRAGDNNQETDISHEDQWTILKTLTLLKKRYPWLTVETTDSYPPCAVEKWYGEDDRFQDEFSWEEVRRVLGICYFGKTNLAVKRTGYAAMCTISRDVHGIANIFENPIPKIWAGEQFKLYRSLKWMPEGCGSCRYISTCLGGCKMGKKGPFGIDRLVGDDDIPLLTDTHDEPPVGKQEVMDLSIDGIKARARRESPSAYTIYRLSTGHIFRPGPAAIVDNEEMERVMANDPQTTAELTRILLSPVREENR